MIQTAPDECVIAGSSEIITVQSPNADRPAIGILSCDEDVYERGAWKPGR